MVLFGAFGISMLVFAGGMDPPDLSWTARADNQYDTLGTSAAWLGDVNGDGHPDVAVGGQVYSTRAGIVRVYSGEDGSTLYTFSAGVTPDNYGCVAGPGDVNRDGYADIVVGASGLYSKDVYSGVVYVYSGKNGSTLHKFYGPYGSGMGSSVAGAGDVNADGWPDIVAGSATWDGYTDVAIVYSGKDGSTLHSFRPVTVMSYLNVAGGGDVNKDGHADILVGAKSANSGRGGVWLYSGKDGSTLYSWSGDTDARWMGARVAGGGDVDGDGWLDVAATGRKLVGPIYCPTVSVFSGYDGGRIHYIARDFEAHRGPKVSIRADVDQDGCADVAAGWLAYPPAGDTGSVAVYSGADSSLLYTLTGNNKGSGFGDSTDMNENGDLVVGAPWEVHNGVTLGHVHAYLSPAPGGSITIDSGAIATASTSVTLGVSWMAGAEDVKSMRLRAKGDSWGNWQDLAAKISWTLPSVEGAHTVEVQFLDEVGRTSSTRSDSILLDRTPPEGTIIVDDGVPWVNDLDVDVALMFTDSLAGVSHVRLRNEGEGWSGWSPATDFLSWSIPAGDGPKLVEAQAKDHAGNTSDVAADSVGLDRTAPTGTVTIEDGAAFAGWTVVRVGITAHDEGGSGVAWYRLKLLASANWDDAWLPLVDSTTFSVTTRSGEQGIDAQFRDRAGNVSATAADSIVVDLTAPMLDSLRINGGRPYLLPAEPIEYTVDSHDNIGGSGVAACRTTTDGGRTFSDWVSLESTNVVPGVRPAEPGPFAVRAVLRDRVGMQSGLSAPTQSFLIEADPPWLGSSGAFAGTLSERRDIDAVAVDLVAGDIVTLKVKAAATPDRKATFPIVMDLTRPDGEWLRSGIRVEGLVGYRAPATGRYILVLREEGEGSETGEYLVLASVKPPPANVKWKGVVEDGWIAFEATAGALLKASLKGPGLDPSSLRLTGPDGDVETAVTGKPGSAKLAASLVKGTGTYRLTFTAGGPVVGSWSLKRPKGLSLREP
jgi:hypothetical protein